MKRELTTMLISCPQAAAMQQYMQHHGVNPHLAQQQLTPATIQQLQLAGMLDQQFIS